MPRKPKKRSHEVEAAASAFSVVESRQDARPKCWQAFFTCQRNPMYRSQLLAYLLAGAQTRIAYVPKAALLDCLLLAMAARNYCAAEIVDDYTALMDNIKEVWAAPDYTHRVMDQIHGLWAHAVGERGAVKFLNYEEQYIPTMVAWYLGHQAPTYFARELTDTEVYGVGKGVDSAIANSATGRASLARAVPVRRGSQGVDARGRGPVGALVAAARSGSAEDRVKRRK